MGVGDLRIRLFGEVEPDVGSTRAESLLAYLIVHRQGPVPRQRLAYRPARTFADFAHAHVALFSAE
jgi:hypothetical protein